MHKPLISIIIPAYNVEKYIERCLDSIINQTLSEIEIVCVNDGSSDNTLSILKKYADKDSRIKIIDQENSGLSVSRNKGIELSSGQYLLFVDADDWIEENTCEVVYVAALKYKADVVMFSCRLEYANKTLYKYAFDEDFLIFDKNECKTLHRRHAGMVGRELSNPEKQDYLCSVCTKLYKKEIIERHNIKFTDTKEIGSYEDGLFNLYYFSYINTAVYIKNYLYHYRKNNEISRTSKYRPNLSKQWDCLYSLIEKYIKDNNLPKEFIIGLQNRIALGIIGLGLNIISSNKKHTKKIKEIKEVITASEYRIAIKQLRIDYMPIHWKVFFYFVKRKFYLGVYFLLIIMNKLRGKI